MRSGYPRAVVRGVIVAAVWLLAAAAGLAASVVNPWWWPVAGVIAALAAVGTVDLLQTRHSILRNYPILGHARFVAERIRPEIRQYFVESDTEATPFDRETRDLVYERSKGTKGDEPFGTLRDVNALGYEFLRHSLRATVAADVAPRVIDEVEEGPSDRAHGGLGPGLYDAREIRPRTPWTKAPESSVENSLASSTASSMATAAGTASL